MLCHTYDISCVTSQHRRDGIGRSWGMETGSYRGAPTPDMTVCINPSLAPQHCLTKLLGRTGTGTPGTRPMAALRVSLWPSCMSRLPFRFCACRRRSRSVPLPSSLVHIDAQMGSNSICNSLLISGAFFHCNLAYVHACAIS